MTLPEESNDGNCKSKETWQLYTANICRRSHYTKESCTFGSIFFITDDAQMVSWLVLLPYCPEDSSSNHGAGKNESTEIVIFYYLEHTSITH